MWMYAFVTVASGNDEAKLAVDQIGSFSIHILVQGFVTVSLAGKSFDTTSGGQISLSAAPLTYRKQTACIPVVTTASEYT